MDEAKRTLNFVQGGLTLFPVLALVALVAANYKYHYDRWALSVEFARTNPLYYAFEVVGLAAVSYASFVWPIMARKEMRGNASDVKGAAFMTKHGALISLKLVICFILISFSGYYEFFFTGAN